MDHKQIQANTFLSLSKYSLIQTGEETKKLVDPHTAGGVGHLYRNPETYCQTQVDASVSSGEAEYKTRTYAVKEGMYFINLLQNERITQITPVQTHIDNIGVYGRASQYKQDNKKYLTVTILGNKSKHARTMTYHM